MLDTIILLFEVYAHSATHIVISLRQPQACKLCLVLASLPWQAKDILRLKPENKICVDRRAGAWKHACKLVSCTGGLILLSQGKGRLGDYTAVAMATEGPSYLIVMSVQIVLKF